MSVFKLPDLGEGLQDAEILEWLVKEGDVVEVDQPLVVVETAKAAVEIPSPQAGKILKLYGAAQDIVNVGEPLIEFEGGAAAQTDSAIIAEGTFTKGKTADTGTVVGEVKVGKNVVNDKVIGQ